MTDRDRKDPGLEGELEHLGEAAATEEERALAAHLAGRLEGGPQAVGEAESEEELASLAELSRALGGGAAGAKGGKVATQAARAAEAATQRALGAIYGAEASGALAGEPAREVSQRVAPEAPVVTQAPVKAPADRLVAPAEAPAHKLEAPVESPADELELRRARRFGEAVDRLVAGVTVAPVLTLGAEEVALLETAEVVRVSTRARRLSASRLEALVDEAVGRTQAPRRYRGGRVLLAVGLAGALAASVVGLVMLWGQEGPRGPEVPAHLASRSTRDILPGAFPRSQSESERIDLIYQDRLRAYRDLELGVLAPAPDAPREGPAAPTAALASRLGGGGIP